DLPDVGSGAEARRRAPRRSAAVRAHRAERLVGASGRAHARRAARGLVRRELQPGGRLEGHLGAETMISRVADHCFWLGRYLERAEHTARVLHVTATLALDAELSPRQTWA